MDLARQEAGIMFANRFEFSSDGGHIPVIPDGVRAANGQAGSIRGDTHRFVKRPKMRVDDAVIAADKDDLACLVGRDG
jgi:hypothetical protein